MVQFVDSLSGATPGEYRDECGRLCPAEATYCQQITGMEGDSPRYSSPDDCSKLPSMREIYQAANLRAITGRPEIDLTGWKSEDTYEPWEFKGIESTECVTVST